MGVFSKIKWKITTAPAQTPSDNVPTKREEPKTPPAVPVQTDADAIMYQSTGKYARHAVLAVFEMLGGADEMARWAEENKTDYYTKIFTKTITKEVETKKIETVDDWLEEAIDADYEVKDDGDG